MDIKYCISHEHSVMVQDSLVGKCHEYPIYTEFGLESDWCFFEMGMTSTPPPEYDEDWDVNLVEPGDEELAKMDASAEDLLVELEGE